MDVCGLVRVGKHAVRLLDHNLVRFYLDEELLTDICEQSVKLHRNELHDILARD